MNRIKKIRRALKMELREHESSFRVYTVLRFLMIANMIFQFYRGNYESGFVCILTLILLIMPSLIQVSLRIEFPTVLEITILLFIFAAEILGETHEFYIIFPHWDTLLHTLNGFLMAAIGLSLVNLLNKSDKMTFSLSPLFTAIVAFCFSMTIGVLWEMFEFAMDQFFLLDMQKDTIVHQISTVMLDPTGGNARVLLKEIGNVSINGDELGLGGYLDIGLIDTMHDLIVNFIGAVIFAIIGYFYTKNKNENSVIKRLVPRKKNKDRDFLSQIKESHQSMGK